MNKALFDSVSQKCSKYTTHSYSTSFTLGILLFDKSIRSHIYSIYGFVRFADEIVDTFHSFDRARLLEKFQDDTYTAINDGISLNPILNSFQHTVHRFNIEKELIDLFLNSMEMDLEDQTYDKHTYDNYILGSAEVVGLMCLKVFCLGDEQKYQALKDPAMKLGSAFQKINFLRDLNDDYERLGRTYFPGVDLAQFDSTTKVAIEADISEDFRKGYEGITRLPRNSRFGVYLAYVYYYALFKKIQRTHSKSILQKRIRISNQKKYLMLFSSLIRYNLNIL